MIGSRLRIFIDGAYLFKVFDPHRQRGYRYSLKRLQRRLSENYNLIKVHYYDAINMKDLKIRRKQEKFYYGYLRDQLGWEVVVLPLQWPGGIAKQKGIDNTLSLHLHDLAVKHQYETAILIAADADFVPSVNLSKEAGKVLRNAYFSARQSFHLQQSCNGPSIRLDDIDFIFQNNNPRVLLTLSSLKSPSSN